MEGGRDGSETVVTTRAASTVGRYHRTSRCFWAICDDRRSAAGRIGQLYGELWRRVQVFRRRGVQLRHRVVRLHCELHRRLFFLCGVFLERRKTGTCIGATLRHQERHMKSMWRVLAWPTATVCNLLLVGTVGVRPAVANSNCQVYCAGGGSVNCGCTGYECGCAAGAEWGCSAWCASGCASGADCS